MGMISMLKDISLYIEECQLFLASWCETTLTVLPPSPSWLVLITKLKHKAVRLTWISQKVMVHKSVITYLSAWWLNQPIWKNMLVKLDHLPQVGMKIENIWNHHLVTNGIGDSFYPLIVTFLTSWDVTVMFFSTTKGHLCVHEGLHIASQRGPFEQPKPPKNAWQPWNTGWIMTGINPQKKTV